MHTKALGVTKVAWVYILRTVLQSIFIPSVLIGLAMHMFVTLYIVTLLKQTLFPKKNDGAETQEGEGEEDVNDLNDVTSGNNEKDPADDELDYDKSNNVSSSTPKE